MAAIAASIMPSPVPFASILPSSWPSTTGHRLRRGTTVQLELLDRVAMHEAGAEPSATIASRSASVISTFLSASSLNRTNAPLSESPCTWKPSFECVREGMTSGVLAENDLRTSWPTTDCVDDLVGLAIGQHAVLVDAGLVRERAADHRLVELHVVTSESGDQPRRARQLLTFTPQPVK